MASAGGLGRRAVSRTITCTAQALWPGGGRPVLGLARASSSRELGSIASTSIARRIGKRAMAHGAGSVGLYTAFTPAVPYAAVSNTQARSLQRSREDLLPAMPERGRGPTSRGRASYQEQQKAPLGQREQLEEVHDIITKIARDHTVHPRKPFYALMNLVYERLAASPTEKFDTAVRIWKALEHRSRNLSQPRIDILPEMYLALLRVHVGTSHPADLPTVAKEMARHNVNETEEFLLVKARCAAQIGDVPATTKLVERCIKEHGIHPRDALLSSPMLTAYLNNYDFPGAFALLQVAAPSENDVPQPRPKLTSFVQILHHCGRAGNVRMVDQVIETMRDCGYVDGFTLRFFNNLVVAYALAGRMDGMTEAMRVRQRAGLAVEPTDEAAFYRACLSGDFEEAAEVGTRFLEAGKYVNKTTILALLKAYTMRGDSDRGLELLLFLDSLGWRLQSVQPRQIWVTALKLFISTGDHDSAVKLIKYLIADHPEQYDHYMVVLAQQCISHSVLDEDVTLKQYQVAVAQRAESFVELDRILEENTIQRRAYLEDTGGIQASESPRMYNRAIWESKVAAMTKLKAPKDARTSLQLVDHQISMMKRHKWQPMDAATASRLDAVTNDIRFARFSDNPEKVRAIAVQEAEDVVADAMSLIESNRAGGKSVMPAVAMALIGLEIERKPLKATLKTLERLQRVFGLHPTNALPYEAILDYLARHDRVDDSITLLNKMESENVYLQPQHFRDVFRLCGERGDAKRATDAYIMVRANDVPVTQETVEILFETYCKADDRDAAQGLMKGVGYYDPLSEQTYAKLLFSCLEAFGEETMIQMHGDLQLATDVIQFTPKEIQASAVHDDAAETTYSDEDAFVEDGVADNEDGEDHTEEEQVAMVEIAPDFTVARPETVEACEIDGASAAMRARAVKVKAAKAKLKDRRRPVYKKLQALPTEGPFVLHVHGIPKAYTKKQVNAAFDAAFKGLNRRKFRLLTHKAKTEHQAFVEFDSRDDLALALAIHATFDNGKKILTGVGKHKEMKKPTKTDKQTKTERQTRRSQMDSFASSLDNLRSALKKLSGQNPVDLEVADALDRYEEAEAVDLQEMADLLEKYYQDDLPEATWQHVVAAYLSPGPVNYTRKVKSADMAIFENNTIQLTDKILLQFLDVMEDKTNSKYTVRSAADTTAELQRLMKRLLDVWKPGPQSTAATIAIFDYYSASNNHMKAKEYFSVLTDSRGPHVLHGHARKRLVVNLLLLLAQQRDFKTMSKILDENLQTITGLDDATTLKLVNVLLSTMEDDGRTLAKALFTHCVKRKTGVGQEFSEKLRLIEYYAETRNLVAARQVYDLIEAEGQIAGEWANLFLIRAYAKEGSFAAMEEAELIMAKLQTGVAAKAAESKYNAQFRETLVDKLTLGREMMIQGYSHALTSVGSNGPEAEIFIRLKNYLAVVAQSKHRTPKRETLVALSTALAHTSVDRADLFIGLYQNVAKDGDAARMLKAYMSQSLFHNAKPNARKVIDAMDARDNVDCANFEFLLNFTAKGKTDASRKAFKMLFALIYKLPQSSNLSRTLIRAYISKMQFMCDGPDELKATLLDLRNAVDQNAIVHSDRKKIAKIFADAGLDNPGLEWGCGD